MILTGSVLLLLCVIRPSFVCCQPQQPEYHDWFIHDGSFYKYFGDKMDFDNAMSTCDQHNADITPTKNEAELKFIYTFRSGDDNGMWLGARRDNQTGNFTHWLDGERITQYFWATGQPDNAHQREDCLQQRYQNDWNDAPCDTEIAFVCKSRSTAVTRAVEWVFYETREWWEWESKRTWQQAAKFCRSKDGHLPIVHSQLAFHGIRGAIKNNFDAPHTNSTKPESLWTGLHSISAGTDPNVWVYDCTRQENALPFWASGEPDHGGPNKPCVSMTETPDGGWRLTTNKECSTCFAVVCEFDNGDCTFEIAENATLSVPPDFVTGNVYSSSTCQVLCLHLRANGEECVAAAHVSTSAVCKMYLGCRMLTNPWQNDEEEEGTTLMIRKCFRYSYNNTLQPDSNGLGRSVDQCTAANHTMPNVLDNAPPDVEPAVTCNRSEAENSSRSSTGSEDLSVVFVLDASSSVPSQLSWTPMLRSVSDFIEHLLDKRGRVYDAGLNTSNVEVGLVQFSENPTVITEPATDFQTVNKSVQEKATYRGGTTSTHLGLEEGLAMLSSSSTARKVLVVVTAGDSADPCSTRNESQTAKNNDVTVHSVGIGSNVTDIELLRLAGDPCHVHRTPFGSFPCLPLRRKVGAHGLCCKDSECGRHMTCQNQTDLSKRVCTCDTEYFRRSTDGQCGRKLNKNCKKAEDCADGMECQNGTNLCVCTSSLAPRQDRSCGKKVGDDCQKAEDCATGMECQNETNICACTSGFVPRQDKTCGKKVNDDCQKAEDCADGMECQKETNLCVCTSGFVRRQDRTCGRKLDDACQKAEDCADGMECKNETNACVCKSGLAPRQDGYCGKKVDDDCQKAEDCANGMECPKETNLCVCTSGFVRRQDRTCGRKLGDACKKAEDCADGMECQSASGTDGKMCECTGGLLPTKDRTCADISSPDCPQRTSNYQLSSGVMSYFNCIEAHGYCVSDNLLFPILESPSELGTLARCICRPENQDTKPPAGFHVRVKIPKDTPVAQWVDIDNNLRFYCRPYETWNVHLYSCPGLYSVHKCSVDCLARVTLDITPVPVLCQKSGPVPSEKDCPALRKCRPSQGIVDNCDPGKFPRCCKCIKIEPPSQQELDQTEEDVIKKAEENKAELKKAIEGELTEDKSKLSKSKQKLTSSSDTRPSANYAGYAAITALSLVFGSIVLSDLPRFFIALKQMFRKIRRIVRRRRRRVGHLEQPELVELATEEMHNGEELLSNREDQTSDENEMPGATQGTKLPAIAEDTGTEGLHRDEAEMETKV